MTYVLGIDKGTTATKAVVLRAETGEALATARRQTPVFHPHPDWHEEDMDLTFAAVAETIREAIAKAGITSSEIAAIGVSGHMGGLWTLDAAGQPLGHAVAWPDARAAEVLAEWHVDGRDAAMFDICGNAPIPGLPLVLLSWLKSHEPERYAKISTVFCAKDYINFRLTGAIATDESDLSFFPCDIRNRCVSSELLALAGVPEIAGCLAPVLSTGKLVGRITEEAADLTGLAKGTPVVSGAGDAVAAAIGVGALAPGQAVTVIGTSFMNNLTIDAPMLEPRNVGFLFLMPGGRWQRLMSNTGGGSLCLDWALSALGQVTFAVDDPTVFARIEVEARNLPPVPNGLIVHPYLGTSGMTAPRHDPTARGSVFGLDMATTPISLIRAVMEGVAFSMVDCYEVLSAPVTDIRLTGGGARSRLWCEICSAVMNRPLLLPEVEETGALGVAMLAAVHAGFHPDLATAALRMVRIADTVLPNPVWAVKYAAAYPLFRDLGRDLIPLWKHRAALLAPRHTQGTP